MISFNFESVRFFQRILSTNLKVPFRNSYTNRELPYGYKTNEAAIQISNNLLNSSVFLSKLCENYKINCFQFLQPVAAIKYNPNGEKFTDWIEDINLKNRYIFGYQNASRKIKKISKNYFIFNDLSQVFLSYEGIPYVDGGHYTPRANKVIAEKIFQNISQNINLNNL